MTIARIISGGQTGVDIAALRAAKARRIPTGGTMPKGFRTLIGPMPEWALKFGLAEHTSPAYPPRTYQNVRDSDMTIRLALDFSSAGERCTRKAVDQYRKPLCDVSLRRHGTGLIVDESDVFMAGEFVQALSARLGRAVVVNFAGNSEKTVPGIERAAECFVKMIIDSSE